MKNTIKRKAILVLAVSAVLALAMFLVENLSGTEDQIVTRNTYGGGKKTEEYELTVEDELKDEPFQIEVEERAYIGEEIQELFQKVSTELDKVILGENKSFDRIEKDLNLVSELENYPVYIRWELDSYNILDVEGTIQKDDLPLSGTPVGLRGTVTYGQESMVYTRYVMVYPPTRTGTEKLLYEIRQELLQLEKETRDDENFTLPKTVSGRTLTWNKKSENRWQYILILGVVLSAFLLYREQEKRRQEKKKRKEELLREYPGMISKLTMLLGTGSTVKNAWEKIVQNYEQQNEDKTERVVYEEMRTTLHEMQGGIAEAEAYERFGKRCGTTAFLKFGTLLSQNLRKGGKGMSEILRVEAIQSFENRKSTAKRLGEEAGTKLLMPMLGMLAVVLIMVMVPAFLTMQL